MRTHNRLGLFFFAAFIISQYCGPSAMGQRPGDFRVLGPGGGGAMYFPAISPHDPQTVLVACDMSGSYITHDGGHTWRMFNLRTPARGFVFDPVDPKTIYALAAGIWRSKDNGDTWSLMLPSPTFGVAIADAGDEDEITIMTSDPTANRNVNFGPATVLAIDPTDNKQMYTVLPPKLWHSRDAGAHWAMEDTVSSRITHMAVIPRVGDRIAPAALMANESGFTVSMGTQPLHLELPNGVAQFSDESIDLIGGKALLLATAKGVLYQTWFDPAQKQPALAWNILKMPDEATATTVASGHDGRTLYVSFDHLSLNGDTWQGIAKTEDMGAHWTFPLKDAGKGVPNFADAWITTTLGSDWGDEPLGLAVAEHHPEIVYATDLGRTYKSADGGQHWAALYSHTGADGGATTNGLDVLTSWGVFFDPFEPRRIFLANSDVGLMRSENGGESWWSSFTGCPRAWRNTTYSMAFDPAVHGRVWAAMSQNHDLPRPRMLGLRHVEAFHGGVCVSSDGGKSWTASNQGLPDGATTHILMDPKSASNTRTLYAATIGHGVFKSIDGGANWMAKNNGLTQPRMLAWRLALAGDGTLYAVMVRVSERATPSEANDGAIYRSRDGAETWERVPLPKDVNGPNDLTIDPRDPSRMYLSAWPRETGKRGSGGGIFGTSDGGAHWRPLFVRDQHIFEITFNPENPSELYAASFQSSVWHSIDRGEHWTRIAGYNFKNAIRVTPDPVHSGMVFINTFGGGLWYGQVGGKSGVEDIATKEMVP